MNKTELVATVAEVSGKPKADVKEVLEALLGQIIKTVISGTPAVVKHFRIKFSFSLAKQDLFA